MEESMNLDNVTRDDWILGGIALVLVIDLLFLAWFDISVGPLSFSFTATDSPDGWLGILAVLSALALIADIAIERLTQTELPTIGGDRASTRKILATAAAAFVALKFLFHIHFSLFGIGFWLGAILAIALAVLVWRPQTVAR
jgi:hypothetical protein